MKLRSMSILIVGAIAAAAAQAGVYSDDLSKCLVAKTSAADQTIFMQWMFSALSSSPAVKSMSAVTEEQHARYNQLAGELFSRLVISDCHAQSVAALKYEGPSAFADSFQLFGQVAARGLISDPEVQKQLQGLTPYFDKEKMKQLGVEPGTPESRQPAAPGK